jgi:hypothetical protein
MKTITPTVGLPCDCCKAMVVDAVGVVIEEISEQRLCPVSALVAALVSAEVIFDEMKDEIAAKGYRVRDFVDLVGQLTRVDNRLGPIHYEATETSSPAPAGETIQ